MAELKELGTLVVVVGKAVCLLRCAEWRVEERADEVEESSEQVQVRKAGPILYGHCWRGETTYESYQAVCPSLLSSAWEEGNRREIRASTSG